MLVRKLLNPILSAVIVASLFLGGRASTALAAVPPAVSPTIGPNNKYPVWNQDANGPRLAPCLDRAATNCREQVAGEHETAEQRVKNRRRNAFGSPTVQPLTSVLEVLEQVPVNAVGWVEITPMLAKELSRLDADQELLDLRPDAIKDGDETRKVRFRG